MIDQAYRSLTEEEKTFHILEMYQSGVFASGEANFFDIDQSISGYKNFPEESSIFSPSGFIYISGEHLSNAYVSKESGINDFNIFNPYIHYVAKADGGEGEIEKSSYAFKIDYSVQFNEIAEKFNIYSAKYRKDLEENT
jgi:hypothetical protein